VTSADLARLDELAPAARPWFEALIRGMQRRGFDPYIGTVWRSPMQQLRAIVNGTTSKRQALSWHMLSEIDKKTGDPIPRSRAVDFRRRLEDGTRDPTTTGPDDFWRALYAESAAIPGMRCLAYKPDGSRLLLNGKTWDPGHVEFRLPHVSLKAAVRVEAPHLLA
jgi:hypothetical protein